MVEDAGGMWTHYALPIYAVIDYIKSMHHSSHSPQNHGHIIAECNPSCLVPSHVELMPLNPAMIPVVHPPSWHKCSISSTQRRMEQRIKMVLHSIYPSPWPTFQGPLPFLSTLSLHPLSYHPFINRALLLLVA
jgi:hypothetical protein